MTAAEKARSIIEKFGTRDCLTIAKKSGVKIVYQNWHPVTIGEYDKKMKTIRVNLRALTDDKFSADKIIAHELGHFFAAEFNFNRKTEEIFACEFAEEFNRNIGEEKNKIRL